MATGIENNAAQFLAGVPEAVQTLPRYNAGLSIEYVRERYGLTEIAKLGSNENPYGPSPRVREALRQAVDDVALYPDPNCDPLRALLSERLHFAPEQFIFGNGSEDLIAVAFRAFLAPGDRVVTFAPSFGLHVIDARSIGAEVTAVPVNSSYAMDIDQVIAALQPAPRILIFGNPSNPVGTSITAADFHRITAALPQQSLLIFDEAYLEYASADPSYPDFLTLLRESEVPWIILRTLSKAYGLAGLRIGYGIASAPELIEVMGRVRSPFNVNRLAQVAAIAALQDMAHVEDVVRRTVAERARVRAALEQLGFHPAPSLANFLFVRANENASDLAARLLTKGVIVKPWTEPAYSDHLRVSIGAPHSNDQFLQAWAELAAR